MTIPRFGSQNDFRIAKSSPLPSRTDVLARLSSRQPYPICSIPVPEIRPLRPSNPAYNACMVTPSILRATRNSSLPSMDDVPTVLQRTSPVARV
eukprot:TRINITY_DN21380_c0_g1_i1.p1 TRINITY_DN21380_c0_g1~~TRINITY_DN21380_c0_g1_i1.p1  ORF type:complete len:107 (+),score=0.27 TRINITY_DN21380_c0_g1_i1:41-322(+)